MGCVYQLKFSNGKSYVGYTTLTAGDRFKRHVSAAGRGSQYAVHHALRKYGEQDVRVLTLAESDELQELLALEQAHIERLGTLSPCGYNMTTGGEHPNLTDESRLKLSQALKDQAKSPGARDRRVATAVANNASQEVRDKIARGVSKAQSEAYAAGKVSPTKGKPMPTAAENGRRGAAKQSVMATGRKRSYREDGTWFWIYPLRLAA